MVVSYNYLTIDTVVNHVDDSGRRSGVRKVPDVKENDETQKEINHDASHGEENKSLVKGVTCSEPGVLLANVFVTVTSNIRYLCSFDVIFYIVPYLNPLPDYPVRSKERLAEERREPLGVGTRQEMDFQTKEGLQVLQGVNRKEEKPEEYPLMHTAAKEGM